MLLLGALRDIDLATDLTLLGLMNVIGRLILVEAPA